MNQNKIFKKNKIMTKTVIKIKWIVSINPTQNKIILYKIKSNKVIINKMNNNLNLIKFLPIKTKTYMMEKIQPMNSQLMMKIINNKNKRDKLIILMEIRVI